MRYLYFFLPIFLLCNNGFSQNINKDIVQIKPQFTVNKPYNYNLILNKLEIIDTDTLTIASKNIPISLNLYSEGEGFYLFEWSSQPMLFFKDLETITNYPSDNITIRYRTDENFVLGEVSNYEEIIQEYDYAYKSLINKTIDKDLSANSALYFIQIYHLLYGQDLNISNKKKLINLYFNPMQNKFTSSQDEILVAEEDSKIYASLNQVFNQSTTDQTAKMLNFKKVSDFKNSQQGEDYLLKAWGNQQYLENGLVDYVNRWTEIKQNNKTYVYHYQLIKL